MKNIIFIVALFVAGVFVLPSDVQATGLSIPVELEGFAWSSTIGWISMNCSNDGLSGCATSDYKVVAQTDGSMTGYGWSSNIGWIRFDAAGPYPSGSGTAAQSATVVGNHPDVTLVGWARACAGATNVASCSGGTNGNSGGWDGWISLDGDIPAFDTQGYTRQHCGLNVPNPAARSLHNVRLQDGSLYDLYDLNSSSATLEWVCTGPNSVMNASIEAACGLNVPNPAGLSLDDVRLQDGSTYDFYDSNASTATLEWGCSGAPFATQLETACGFDVPNPTSGSLNNVRLQGGGSYDLYDTNASTATLVWSCTASTPPTSIVGSYGITFVDGAATANSYAWGGATNVGWIDFSPDAASGPAIPPVEFGPIDDIVILGVANTPGTPDAGGFYDVVTFTANVQGIPLGETVDWELSLGSITDSGTVTQTASGPDFSSIPTLVNVPFSVTDPLTLEIDMPEPGTVEETNETNVYTDSLFSLATPPPTMTISGPEVVRSGESAEVSWEVSAPYPVTCTVQGPGVNETVIVAGLLGNPDTQSGSATSADLTNAARFEVTCVVGSNTYTEVYQVEVIPTFQEI